jgi:hypothetical protein
LLAIWKRACDARDIRGMTIAMRAVDAAIAGRIPNEADLQTIKNYVRRGRYLSAG